MMPRTPSKSIHQYDDTKITWVTYLGMDHMTRFLNDIMQPISEREPSKAKPLLLKTHSLVSLIEELPKRKDPLTG